MAEKLSKKALLVQNVLNQFDLKFEVVELPDSTRTAQDAANALGCKVAHIAKSLVFRGKESGKYYLIIASGVNRVDERKIGSAIGEEIEIADAKSVEKATGFAVGGIPPVGHKNVLPTYIDEDLLKYDDIWAAAGTPHAVFQLSPRDLKRITKGQVVEVK